MKKIWLVFLLLACLAAPAFGDGDSEHFKVGLSASLQGENVDILLPIWMSDKLVIIPAVSFAYLSDAATDMAVGFALRRNVGQGDAVPFVGARFMLFILNPEGNSSGTTDFVFGPFAGGEYFFHDHFSIGVEAQVNIAKSDKTSLRFGHPDGTTINTATAVFATYYF